MAKEVIGPSSPKQEMMLTQSADLAILGGAMGSGKSYISLLYPLKFADDPHFRGIMFRKTTGEITAQGGLWENACEIYTRIYGDAKELRKQGKSGGIKIHVKDLRITFPAGGSIKFSYLERDADLLRHQGAAYTFVLFDEATHFSLKMVEYLIKRMRSARAKHQKQMVLTCNPDPDWECLDWVKPYLIEDGTPNLSMDGKMRYYVVDKGQYVWSDAREELEKIYGTGADSGIRSFTFISANCTDNIPLMKADPSYLSNLKSQPWVDVQRYLYGNWFVRESKSGYFNRTWVEEVVGIDISQIDKLARSYDMAGTLKSETNVSPDYTVATLVAKMKDSTYVVLDVKRTRIRYGDWEKFIIENALEDSEKYKGKSCTILVPQDPNPAAQAATSLLIRNLADKGLYAEKMRASSSKLDRFRPFSASAQNGGIKFVAGCGTDLENGAKDTNEFIYKELEAFDGTRRRGEFGHDDIPDALSDAFAFLASKIILPNFLSSVQKFQSAIGEQKIVSL